MKILIHALSTKMGGAKRHLDNMVNALAKNEENHHYVILVNNQYDTTNFDSSITLLRYSSSYGSGIRRIYFDNVLLPRILKKYRFDILVSFANFGPFITPCPHILFEMNALYFCSNIFDLYPFRRRLDFWIKRALIGLTGAQADIIVTPSHSLAKQIQKTFPLSKKKFEVLYHAMDPAFTKTEERNSLFCPDRVSFLYPSHLARHKGVHILIDALNFIKKRSPSILNLFEIVCTFDRSDDPEYYDELKNKIRISNLQNTIRFIGHQPQNKINTLYAGADYMIYTTLCESFGFSMLEAKVFRLPALCSDIAINREISQKSAKYYKWNDPVSLAKELENFVVHNPKEFFFEDSLLNWHWDAYAEKFLSLCEKACLSSIKNENS